MENLELTKVLIEILVAITTATLPIVAKYVIEFLQTITDAKLAKMDNEYVASVISKVEQIVIDCVQNTNQTFVDTLKNNGGFGEAEWAEARDLTMKNIKALLKEDISVLIEEEYGNIDVYLDTIIEKTVNELKK